MDTVFFCLSQAYMETAFIHLCPLQLCGIVAATALRRPWSPGSGGKRCVTTASNAWQVPLLTAVATVATVAAAAAAAVICSDWMCDSYKNP